MGLDFSKFTMKYPQVELVPLGKNKKQTKIQKVRKLCLIEIIPNLLNKKIHNIIEPRT